MKVLNFIYKWS